MAGAPKVQLSASKQPIVAEKAPQKSVQKNTVSPEHRNHMISTAAYFLAEQRGFSEGYEMEDWNSSEIWVDAMLNT